MLSWPERIASYRQRIGVPYLGHENGWTNGTWFLGNSYEKKTGYYGGFQGNFPQADSKGAMQSSWRSKAICAPPWRWP
jgi:hypothetical protein